MANGILNATDEHDLPNGLVLLGGRSTRMGTDKSLLVYHDKPQRDHVTELLQPYCNRVFWSVNTPQWMGLTEAEQAMSIVDAYNLNSPLDGILSAFLCNPTRAWFVVACDLPLLTNLSLDALLAGRDPEKLATVFLDSDGQLPEPLLGIYEPAFGPVARQAVENGEISPRQILLNNPVQLLTAPDLRELTNANDPATRIRLHP